ncbi:unnamed protein product [Linum perenne]
MAVLVIQAHGALHKVGDSVGWTIIGSPDYEQWAAAKTFQLGDVVRKSYVTPNLPCFSLICYILYNPQFHNVMKVTHAMYRACNASAPLETYTTGNDSITITTRGHHFFICGVPGHCLSGQKVDINVLRTDHSSSSSAALSPGAVGLSPNLTSAQSPAPSTNSAFPSFTLIMPLTQALLLAGALFFHHPSA